MAEDQNKAPQPLNEGLTVSHIKKGMTTAHLKKLAEEINGAKAPAASAPPPPPPAPKQS